ncbi:hypothetical protein QFZ87_000959 [Bacillus sp. SLBN-46]|uniref:hypothetical protein n=1 Tax=Bacillus sp. SLBN-46 TaxID=3042283 RepID=UPI00286272A3|nr:hypothetical protein [Bacillus sp. SLBN-46]MDR6121362.1 hypothetical protein [Bacillus sp. SLBN-46]
MFEETSLVIGLLVASLVVNLVTMIVVIVSFRRKQLGAAGQREASGSVQAAAASAVTGIVFCRACGNQYDSTSPACPNCKTAR